MEAKKHSPLPWKFTGDTSTSKDGCGYLEDESGDIFCHLGDFQQLKQLNLDNAAFIVHACNNIEKVTAERDALIGLLKENTGEDCINMILPDVYEDWFRRVIKTIKSIEGTK